MFNDEQLCCSGRNISGNNIVSGCVAALYENLKNNKNTSGAIMKALIISALSGKYCNDGGFSQKEVKDLHNLIDAYTEGKIGVKKMSTIESLLREGITLKWEIEARQQRLRKINKDIAEQAEFKPGSSTGHIAAGGIMAKVTKRQNVKWDQDALAVAHKKWVLSFSPRPSPINSNLSTPASSGTGLFPETFRMRRSTLFWRRAP